MYTNDNRRIHPVIFVMALVVLAFVLAGITLVGTVSATQPNPNHKVDVCHRTGSASNPYVFINVDIASSGYVKGGHTNHEQIGNGLGGDIIDSYVYIRKDGSYFFFPGKNLDTFFMGESGRSILLNGCKFLAPRVTPSPTPSNTPGETPAPSGSPSGSPSDSGKPSASQPDLPDGAMTDHGVITDDGWLLIYGSLMLIILGSAFASAARNRS